MTTLGPRRRMNYIALLCILVILLSTTQRAGVGPILIPISSADSSADSNYSNSASWAVGVVVPENAPTSTGEVLWQHANNITVLFRLPNINITDNTIYLVMSLMTSDGAVIQVAAGLYSNMSKWGTYGMYIQNPLGFPQVYHPVLLSRDPQIAAGNLASMSLYLSSTTNAWSLRLADLDTGNSVHAEYDFGLSPSLRVGDQFVFALESYSSNRSVFENMGNLTLYSLLVNGERVTSGWYAYGGWDNVHYPLFNVGASGPPNFISMRMASNATVVWSYGGGWTATSYDLPLDLTVVFVLLAGIAVIVVFMLAVASRKRRKGINNLTSTDNRG